MARFSPADAVFAGFRFVKERPGTIMVWAGYLLVAFTVASMAMFDIGGGAITAFGLAAQAGHPLNAEQAMKLAQDALPAALFFTLLMTVFGSVLSAAILRVRLKPGPHSWAGLRLGGEELRMLAAKFMVLSVVMLAYVVAMLFAAGIESVGGPAMVGLGVGVGLMLALENGLSLAGVISQTEGRMDPMRSLQLTRLLFWRLAGAYVLLGAILLVILVLVQMLFAALLGAAVLAGGGGVAQTVLTVVQGRITGLNPVVLAVDVLSILVQVWVAVVATVVFLSIAADAYKAAADKSV